MAALMLAAGAAWFAAGGLFFLLAILLERSGDALARARMQGSADPPGERLALFSDSLANALPFAGLGFGLRGGEQGLAAIAMGAVAALGVALLPWLIRRLETIDGRRAAEFGGVAGLEAEDILLLVPVALWAGWAEALLVAVAFIAPTLASAFYMMHYRKFSSG